MKQNIFVILTLIGISLIYLSCNKDNEFSNAPSNTEMIDPNSDIIDLNKLKMPHFATAEDFKSTIEKAKNLTGQEYLEWESGYGIKTIYGDYTRALIELDKITKWDQYLLFRKKWRGKVILSPEKDSVITCYPRKLGYVSKTSTKFLNDNLVYNIGNKTYLYFGNKIIVFNKKYRISNNILNRIISTKNKLEEYEYFTFPRILTNSSIKFRSFSDENSPIDHSPFINEDIPFAKECSDDENPAGVDCRHRLMRSHLTDVFVLYIVDIGSNQFELAIEQDYWVDHYRKIWSAIFGFRWYHNDVDESKMNGDIDGQVYVTVDPPNSPPYYFNLGSLDMSFDRTSSDVDRDAVGVINYYGINYAHHPEWISGVYIDYTQGSGSDIVHYYSKEKLGWLCDYKVIELKCDISFP